VIYLASPYSHSDSSVQEQRFEAVCKKAAELFRAGQIVFSPIAHSHPIAKYGIPGDWQTWEAFDRIMIAACDKIVVLCLDGWKTSKGVAAEIEIAKQLGKPVEYIES
jgi:nucleoside 2-deoxyribosyltransferase